MAQIMPTHVLHAKMQKIPQPVEDQPGLPRRCFDQLNPVGYMLVMSGNHREALKGNGLPKLPARGPWRLRLKLLAVMNGENSDIG